MSDVSSFAGYAGALLAIGMLAERIYARLSAPAPASPAPAPPRETALPPAPAVVSAPCSHAGEIAALKSSVERIEAEQRQGQETRVRLAGEIAKLSTLIEERTSRGGRKGGDRERASEG
mgnify:CR=1 FL=1